MENKKEYTQIEASKLYNVSKQYISKLIKENKLILNNNNKIDKELIEVFFNNKKNIEKEEKEKQKDKNKSFYNYHDAIAKKVEFEARLKELEFLEKEKQLINKEEIFKEVYKYIKDFQESLFNIPKRLAPIIALKDSAAEIEIIIENEIRDTLNNIYDNLNALKNKKDK